jgi:hypothetical protein
MTHTPAKSTTHVIQVRDGLIVRAQYDVPTRGEALVAIAEMRSARPEESIVMITTEVFQ